MPPPNTAPKEAEEKRRKKAEEERGEAVVCILESGDPHLCGVRKRVNPALEENR